MIGALRSVYRDAWETLEDGDSSLGLGLACFGLLFATFIVLAAGWIVLLSLALSIGVFTTIGFIIASVLWAFAGMRRLLDKGDNDGQE